MELHFVVDTILKIGGMQTHAYNFAKHFVRNSDIRLKSILVAHNTQKTSNVLGHSELDHGQQLSIEGLKKHHETDAATLLRRVGVKNAVVFVNEPMWLPMIHLAKTQMPELRVVVRSGGNDLFAGWVAGPELGVETNEFVKLVNACVDRMIVSSDFSRARYEQLGVEAHRMIKIGGGVDCQLFQPASRRQNDICRIANICRFVDMKGIDVAIRAVSELLKRGRNDIHYTVTGSGRRKVHARLSRLVEKLGVSNHVTFAPPMHASEIVSAYQAADLFLHIPRYAKRKNRQSGADYWHAETMGRSLCEAAAVGLPVVTSRVGGVPEIVREGITGFMVDAEDYLSAADYVERLIEDPALSHAMGQAGRRRALASWDWPILFDRYEEAFLDVCR